MPCVIEQITVDARAILVGGRSDAPHGFRGSFNPLLRSEMRDRPIVDGLTVAPGVERR
jgi:hypothetical protein